jgi:ribokinase
MAMKTWEESGVHPAVTRDPSSYTGAAYIFVEEGTGNNAIIVSPGAAATISPEDMDANAELIGSAKIFVTQLEQPLNAAVRALEIARAGGAITVLNPAPAQPLDASVFALCDYVTPNETETEILTGLPVTSVEEAKVAADRLLDMGVKTAIITLGAQGALYHTRTESVVVPAFKAGPVVETTGAGDAFNGGFAAAIARGTAPLDAVRFGSAVAGISVTRPGTAPSMPSLAEVEALLARG